MDDICQISSVTPHQIAVFTYFCSVNIYRLLKIAASGKVPRFVKLICLWAIHISGRRHIGIFLDPVLGCNLRCRMCYFSNERRRREMSGVITSGQLDCVERTFFPRALKLQIGCGAEPTLYPHLADIVSRARKSGVPDISLVTNGQLLADRAEILADLVKAGLNEITVSLHGTRPETYEYLMPGAEYARFTALLNALHNIKQSICPQLKVRLNFTVNTMNMHDLEGNLFRNPWPEGFRPDVVQLRPVQNMGSTAWTDYDSGALKSHYEATFGNVAAYCRAHGITCIVPTLEQIDEVVTPQDSVSALIEDITYCYISPKSAYKQDFNLGSDSFEAYHRRHHTARRLLMAAFFNRDNSRRRNASKKLNYNIK